MISTAIWDKAIAYLDALTASDAERLARYSDRLQAFREQLHNADKLAERTTS